MEPAVREALLESIEKWKRNTAATEYRQAAVGRFDCALCHLFNHGERIAEADCKGCPVEAATGKKYCNGTPYGEVMRVHREWVLVGQSETLAKKFRSLAVEEVAFLESLLPP